MFGASVDPFASYSTRGSLEFTEGLAGHVLELMPSLAGMPVTQAQSRLTSAGLQMPKLTMVSEPGAEIDSVVGQTPAPGARVDPQTTITLQVASMSPPSTTPVSQKPGDETGGPYARMQLRRR